MSSGMSALAKPNCLNALAPRTTSQLLLKLNVNNHSINAFIDATRETLTNEDVNRIVNKIIEQGILVEHGVTTRADIFSLSYCCEPQNEPEPAHEEVKSEVKVEPIATSQDGNVSGELPKLTNGPIANIKPPEVLPSTSKASTSKALPKIVASKTLAAKIPTSKTPNPITQNATDTPPKQVHWASFWKEKVKGTSKDVTDIFLDILSMPEFHKKLKKKGALDKETWMIVAEKLSEMGYPLSGNNVSPWSKCKYKWKILKKRYLLYEQLSDHKKPPVVLLPYLKYMDKMEELLGNPREKKNQKKIALASRSSPAPTNKPSTSRLPPYVPFAPVSPQPTTTPKTKTSHLLSFMKMLSARDERRHREVMCHMRRLEAQNERLISVLELLARPYEKEEEQENKQEQELLTLLKKFFEQHDKPKPENGVYPE